MKKIFIFCSFLTVFNLFAQGKIAEKVIKSQETRKAMPAYQIFDYSKSPTSRSKQEEKVAGTYLTLSSANFQTLYAQSPQNIELVVPYNGENLILELYKDVILAKGFSVKSEKAKKVSTTSTGVFYKGVVKGDATSIVAINIFEDQINGIISSQKNNIGNLVLGKVLGLENKLNYVIYSDTNLAQEFAVPCHTVNDIKSLPNFKVQKTENTTATKCVSVYLEIDYDIYKQNGSDINQTKNWALSVFNATQTLYENDGINIRLQAIKVWDTQDPYQRSTSVANVQAFSAYRTTFDGDVAILLAIDPGSLGGVAYGTNSLCGPTPYAYADVDFSFSSLPTYSWTVGVVTHELGHLLGSPHTHDCVWNGTNTAIDNCGPVAFPGYGGDACLTSPPLLPYQEKGTIMSYCHGVSSVGISFANGFGEQPRRAIQNRINNSTCLSASCVATPIKPTANFSAAVTSICLGKQVKFKDVSTNAPTSWLWTFQGGVPATATTQNPTVTYVNAGNYKVTLTASNAQGADTKEIINYIQVGQSSNTMPNENFQGVFPPENWTITNPDNGITWEKRADVGNGDTACMVINNADNSVLGAQDIITLPYYNFKSLKAATFSFDIAYTQFNASSADVLKIQVSTDCGSNWVDMYSKTHTALETVVVPTANSNAWVPSLPSHWRKEKIDLSTYDGQTSVSIRFVNTSGYGTRIWIDNVRIENGIPLSVANSERATGFSLHPSPSTGIFFITLPELGATYQVKIYTMAGQEVLAQSFVEITDNEQKINLQGQAKGIYLVKLQSNQKESVLKVILK